MDEKIITIIRWNYLLNWPYVYIRGTKNKGILGFHFLFYLKHIKDMESKDFIGSDLHVQKPIVGHTKKIIWRISALRICCHSSWSALLHQVPGETSIPLFLVLRIYMNFDFRPCEFSSVESPPSPSPPPPFPTPTLTPPIRLLTVLQVDWNVLSHTVIFWKMIRLSRNYYT